MDDNLRKACDILCSKAPKKVSDVQEREHKKQARGHIINVLKQEKKTFVEHHGTYIVLKENVKKMPITKELVARAYKEFNSNVQLHGGNETNADVRACRFGEYVFALSKHLGTKEIGLTITKKRPIQAIVIDSMKINLN